MIDPTTVLVPGQRVSVPHELMNQIVSTLGELPARLSMELIISIREQAEIVKDAS